MHRQADANLEALAEPPAMGATPTERDPRTQSLWRAKTFTADIWNVADELTDSPTVTVGADGESETAYSTSE